MLQCGRNLAPPVVHVLLLLLLLLLLQLPPCLLVCCEDGSVQEVASPAEGGYDTSKTYHLKPLPFTSRRFTSIKDRLRVSFFPPSLSLSPPHPSLPPSLPPSLTPSYLYLTLPTGGGGGGEESC